MKRALGATLAVIASCLVAVAPSAAAEDWVTCPDNDVFYPQLKSVTMTPTAATIGRDKRTVTVTIKATDNCALDYLSVQLQSKTSGKFPIYLYPFTLVAGTKANGTWRASKTISAQQPGGSYRIARLILVDTNYNDVDLRNVASGGTMTLRHATTTKLNRPVSSTKKKVTLKGRLRVYGGFGTWNVQVQKKTSGKKWSKVRNVKTNAWGDYLTKVEIKKTTSFRVVHYADSTTTYSASKTYKVKKKR